MENMPIALNKDSSLEAFPQTHPHMHSNKATKISSFSFGLGNSKLIRGIMVAFQPVFPNEILLSFEPKHREPQAIRQILQHSTGYSLLPIISILYHFGKYQLKVGKFQLVQTAFCNFPVMTLIC
jgi:hypothetical protein